MLTQLHAALGHIPGDRSHHGIAFRGDPRIAVRRLGLQYRRVVRHLRAVDQGVRGRRLAHGLGQRGARQFDAFARVPHFLRRDGAVGQQRLALGEIGLGARELQLSGFDGRVVLVGRRFFLAHLANGLRQCIGGAAQIGFRIDRIETHQNLARLRELGVICEHRDHRAGDLRRDHHSVAVHIGIVGLLALRQHQDPVPAPQHA